MHLKKITENIEVFFKFKYDETCKNPWYYSYDSCSVSEVVVKKLAVGVR